MSELARWIGCLLSTMFSQVSIFVLYPRSGPFGFRAAEKGPMQRLSAFQPGSISSFFAAFARCLKYSRRQGLTSFSCCSRFVLGDRLRDGCLPGWPRLVLPRCSPPSSVVAAAERVDRHCSTCTRTARPASNTVETTGLLATSRSPVDLGAKNQYCSRHQRKFELAWLWM